MTKHNQRHSIVLAKNGYKRIKFANLLHTYIGCIDSIILMDKDGSYKQLLAGTLFTYCLHLLRLVAKLNFMKPIELKLTRLTKSFRGKILINGKIHEIDCYLPNFDDISLFVDDKQIINLEHKFPKGFNFMIYSKHPYKQLNGGFEKIVDKYIESFSDVIKAILQIFNNLGIAFIKKKECPYPLTCPAIKGDIEYVVVSYSMKFGYYHLGKQANSNLIKLYWFFEGNDMTEIKFTPREAYLKKVVPKALCDFNTKELFTTHTHPETTVPNIDFEDSLSSQAVQELFGIDITDPIIRSRVLSKGGKIVKLNRIDSVGLKIIADMFK